MLRLGLEGAKDSRHGVLAFRSVKSGQSSVLIGAIVSRLAGSWLESAQDITSVGMHRLQLERRKEQWDQTKKLIARVW